MPAINLTADTCCARHAAELPEGCQQGKLCPERAESAIAAARGLYLHIQGAEAADKAPVTAKKTVTAASWLFVGIVAICVVCAVVIAGGFALAVLPVLMAVWPV